VYLSSYWPIFEKKLTLQLINSWKTTMVDSYDPDWYKEYEAARVKGHRKHVRKYIKYMSLTTSQSPESRREI